ncbi:MAG: hypothetical protein QM611_10145 [Microbacterium sp.]|uniref:hypothetical protein n=1 Tax=Microbacterium sp. TaxID=51671 RepID=UPI0039E3F821
MRRGAVIGIVVGAAVLAAGGGLAWWLMHGESAADAAHRYVHALEEGDRDTLAGFLPDDADRDRLLDMFDGATGRVADAKLSAPASDGGFRAAVTIDGQPGVVLFMLDDSSGAWRLSGDYLGSLEATATIGNGVEIGGVAVAAGATTVLPAVYPVRASPVEILSGQATVAVTNERPVSVRVEASISPDATALAQAQLDEYAHQCARSATAVPPHCGLKVPWGADLASLTSLDFRIEQTPQVELAADAASFSATDGVIVATARGVARDGGEGEFTYRADDWSLRGSVRFDESGMVLAVR